MLFNWLLLASQAAAAPSFLAEKKSTDAPTVTVTNGSYYGVYSSTYDQDLFLGMPYAQPPVNSLRFRVPQPLNTTWEGTKNATEYGYECMGYGSDQWIIGNYISEDCLTINVIRPSGVEEGDNLPVAVWIHGGGYFEGGSEDPRYNLSLIVAQSTKMSTPIVAVSMNYRLSAFGFLFGQEVLEAGTTNLGLRDQRLALHWVQENIAAFGGDPSLVTIWGESAGANSVGTQLVAYGGRDDNLFHAAISESGAVTGLGPAPTLETWQPAYDAIVNATGCSSWSDSLDCLRTIPTQTLSDIINSSAITFPKFYPYADGDFLQQTGINELLEGNFVHVPYLIGTNFDEGASFASTGINTTEQFLENIMSYGADNATALTVAALYPDIPEIGIPATLDGRPSGDLADLGYMYKREAAFKGDLIMHAGRRLTSQTWAANNLSAYTYHFNVLVNGVTASSGAGHFQEVAFVFNNLDGYGYVNAISENPFADKPDSYKELANVMSRMWVSFIVKQDPNYSGVSSIYWPEYTLDKPQNIVFDANETNVAYIEPDTYRAEGMKYLADNLVTSFNF